MGDSIEEIVKNEILKIFIREEMTFKQAKSVLEKIQLIFMESSKNFLDGVNAKKVLETPNRYMTERKLNYNQQVAAVAEKEATTYSYRLEAEQAEKFPNEELKKENFNRVDTDGFEKAIVLVKYWTEMTQKAMLKHKRFRIEINYNAEVAKTDFCIYTLIEGGTDDTKQEHSEN